MSRLLIQIMHSKIDAYNENMIHRNYLRSFWQFYTCYNLAVSILGIQLTKKEIKYKNKMWKKLLLSYGKISDKNLKKFHSEISNDMEIILKAMTKLTKLNDESKQEAFNTYPTDVIGILSYMYPE